MRAYRLIFGTAAAYNAAFGIWAALFPHSFFTLFGLAAPRYPSIWACLGMVIGLYGIAYAYVAWKPERGAVLVWIGLVGKVLGPIGWLGAVWQEELPPHTFPLILTNDLVWWFPFGFYLLRTTQRRRAVIAWICVGFNGVACLALIFVRGGTEAVAEMAERADWVADSVPAWTTAWVAWALASMSLLAFFVVWGARLIELGWARGTVSAGCLLCAVGVLFDLSGEIVNIAWLTQAERTVAEFEEGARLYRFLGPATANGLYCTAGLILSAISWRVGFIRGRIGLVGICMWLVGLALTRTAIIDSRIGMLLTGTAVMALFLPWAALVGWRLRSVSDA